MYTRQRGKRQYHQTTVNGSLVRFLHKRGVRVIPISDSDEQNFGSNYLCIAPYHIVSGNAVSDDFRNRMAQEGVQVEYLELGKLTDGGGCAHCMTQVFLRQP